MPQVDEPTLTIGIDTGGTFTDVCGISSDGAIYRGKAPTTPGELHRGVLEGIASLSRNMGKTLDEVLRLTSVIKHGTTVATNALITRTGPKVGLITTKGFEDIPFIMRAIGRTDGLSEMELRHVAAATKPRPLVDRTCVVGVNERVDYRGNVVIPLAYADADRAINDLLGMGCEAIAVSLLHAWANPVHEQAIRERSARLGAGAYWSFGSDLSQQAGEYARTNTAIIDAYLGRAVDSYLATLEDALREHGFQGSLLIMQGAGGVKNRLASRAIGSLQSGPSGGVSGAKYMAGILGHEKVLTADMGGTSFDVSFVSDAAWRYADEPIFERFRLQLPIIELESIGAGGGTIATVDPITSRLQVGPASAGSVPGPACYRSGGDNATVTDADVVLGYIDPSYFLNGEKAIDPSFAADVVRERIAEPLGVGNEQAAWGVYEVVNSKMADLIRKWVVKSGHLPEEFTLYAFGGACGLHAASVAAELGMEQVIFFPTSAVFSAFGGAVSEIIHTQVGTLSGPVLQDPEMLNNMIKAFTANVLEAATADGALRRSVHVERYLAMRFSRQTFGLQVGLPTTDSLSSGDIEELERRFVEEYEARYGRGAGHPGAGIEAYQLRVDAIAEANQPEFMRSGRNANAEQLQPVGTRRIYYSHDWTDANVFRTDDLFEGAQMSGPCVIEAGITTMLVPPGWSASADEFRNVVLRQERS